MESPYHSLTPQGCVAKWEINGCQ